MDTTVKCFGVAALLCAMPGLACAAPEVNGKFAYMSQSFCEAKLTVTKDGNGKVTSVNLTQAGLMSVSVGYITFNQNTGKATITGATLIEGGGLRVANSGFNWAQKPDNNPTPTEYSFTNTTFTYGGQVYKMVYSDQAGENAFRSVYLMRRWTDEANPDNPNCLEAIWATKQPGEV
jgi:hypothetical protein